MKGFAANCFVLNRTWEKVCLVYFNTNNFYKKPFIHIIPMSSLDRLVSNLLVALKNCCKRKWSVATPLTSGVTVISNEIHFTFTNFQCQIIPQHLNISMPDLDCYVIVTAVTRKSIRKFFSFGNGMPGLRMSNQFMEIRIHRLILEGTSVQLGIKVVLHRVKRRKRLN